jgi:predicted RNase H-like HicB family nuclease
MNEVMINIELERLPEGLWLATSEDMPGLVAQGRTVAETLEIARDAVRRLVESYIEHGDPLPPAFAREAPEHLAVQVPVEVA